MNNLSDTLWIEARKATRSRLPLFTVLGFLVMPFALAFMMVVLKDPDLAQQMGLISAKAQLTAGSADWPTYLGAYAQGIAIGGLVLFSLITSWVFGREFADGMVKDLLAVPVARSSILLAKFIVTAVWCVALTVIVYVLGLVLGAVIVLPQWSTDVLIRGSLALLITFCLVMVVLIPVAFFASFGRGYLPPMGVMLLLVALANVVTIAGWGDYFPWAIPLIYAGMVGEGGALEPTSYTIVLLTGLAGLGATYLWWMRADQNR